MLRVIRTLKPDLLPAVLAALVACSIVGCANGRRPAASLERSTVVLTPATGGGGNGAIVATVSE